MNYSKINILLLLLIPINLYAQDYDGVLEEDVYINLDYTGCYQGSYCPRYEITILGNGTVIFEGVNDISKTGVTQKQIKKQNVADLLTRILELRYFERKDESSDCGGPKVELIGGNYDYESGNGVCYTSSHGPFTDIHVKLGSMERKVQLDHYFSNDYSLIHQDIIKAADVQNLIESKKASKK